MVALLMLGSAILLFSCETNHEVPAEDNPNLLTMQSEDLTMIESANGVVSYRFQTPLLEKYEFAREPYTEFRKGIHVITYDSIGQVDQTLIANYTINLEKQQIWEARGSVVATTADGKKLETEQLFWNQKTGKIYSNVDSKLTDTDGTIVFGNSFESDEKMESYVIRNVTGKVPVDTEPTPEEEAKQNEQQQTIRPPRENVPDNPADPIIREGDAVARPRETLEFRKQE